LFKVRIRRVTGLSSLSEELIKETVLLSDPTQTPNSKSEVLNRPGYTGDSNSREDRIRTTSKRYSPEARARAVHLVLDQQKEHESQWDALGSIAEKIGCTRKTLRTWVRQVERDQGIHFFRTGGARPSTEILVSFIDEFHADYGLEKPA